MSLHKLFLLAALPGLLGAQTVFLSTTPNPSTFGAPVSLTAAVTAFNFSLSGPPTGRVTFYDGVTVLGSMPLVSGTARFSTLLPAGNRKLKAYYSGDAQNSPSTSNTVKQTVNALVVSNFVTVTGGPSSLDQGFSADFNGDGIPDLVVGGAVYLGNGKGGFRSSFQLDPQTLYNFGTLAGVGDFNGDGKPDLVLLTGNSQFGILPGNGDGTFQSPVNTPGAFPGEPIVVADFNGDGKPDIAGSSILLGNGDGTFQIGAALGRVDAILAGDFNGDGIPDLVTSDGISLNLSMLLGKGDGTFRPATPIPLRSNIYNLNVISDDFNGDGKPDLAVVTPPNDLGADVDMVHIYLGRGDGTFLATVSYSLPSGAGESVLTGDFNGDGIPDLVFNGYILAGNGDGTFQPLFGFLEGYDRYTISADFNGDGRPDIYLVGFGNVYLGTTTSITASGGTPQSTPVGSQFPVPLQVSVFDNGVPLSGATVTFAATSGDATLSASTAVTNAFGMASVTATANGKARSYTVTASYQSRAASFSLTNLAGAPATLAASNLLPRTAVVDRPFARALAVVVKDAGDNPVNGVTVNFQAPSSGASAVLSSATAITDASGAASVTATANHIVGSYTVTASVGALSVPFQLTNTPAVSAAVTLTTTTATSTYGAPVMLTANVTPLNATGRVTFYDGIAVLGTKPLATGAASLSTILLQPGTHQLRALYGGDSSYAATSSNVVTERVNSSPGGSFTAQTLNAPPLGGPPVVADFNGDGIADIAFSGAAPNTGAIVVLLGKGDGTYQAPIQTPGSLGPIAVGDFDGDGIPDLFCGGDILVTKGTVFLGNGDGTFRQGAAYTVPNGSIQVADFNNDGNADLLIGDLFLLGKGDGTFTPTGSQTAPIGSAVGDFNGDGKADRVTLNSICVPGGIFTGTRCTVSVSVSLGNGDGTFQSPLQAASESNSNSLANGHSGYSIDGFVLGDFNGDGTADLLYWGDGQFGATAAQPTGLTVLPGKGDGTFGSPQTTMVAQLTGFVVTGDFNGDGITDILLVNHDNTFSVLTGNGDGTFQPSGSVYNSRSISSMLVADFNGDGKADLLISGDPNLQILLGAPSGAGFKLTATGGTPQSAPIGTPFRAPLEVTLLNNGTPVSGTTVTYATPISGASLNLPNANLSNTTAVTDASGVARVTATANAVTGSYLVTASAQGMTVSFSLTNTGFVVTAISGTPQSTPVGTAFPMALQTKVPDASNAGISGVVVTFTAPASGASATLSSPTAVTNASGVATVMATANNVPGTYVVVATVGGSVAQFALTNILPGTTDLALGKTATQSSTIGYPTAVAASAVDGNVDGSFFDGSVTATNSDPNAWWQVDLGTSAAIGSIVIWNRTDCCGDRLSDYWVFVSDTPFLATDTPVTLQNRTGTFASHQTTAPSPSATIVAITHGRYVRVQLTGTGILSLAEVQVLAPGTGPSKFASQSSQYPGSPPAGAAIDGVTDGNFFNGSVTATNTDPNAWWQEDLGASTAIGSIIIWNRTDCCGSRLSDYWVFVSDTPFLATDTPATLQNRAGTFASHQTSTPNPSSTIAVTAQGRYVRVQLSGAGILSLAEVQVVGTGGTSTSNLSQGKAASQSSTLTGVSTAGAASAVDGNTDGNFFDGSVTATNPDTNAWWQVDLGASASVSSVSIYSRTDCCGSRLSDYWVFVSNTPFLATDTPATLQNRAGTFASHQTSLPNPSASIPVNAPGRYVRVQLSGTDYLSLAEVQVMGQ